MLINEISPRKELAEFIRLYRIVDFHFPASIRVPDKAYPPRPEHCLQFQPLHKSEMFYPGRKGMIHNTSVPILVGQQTVLHYRQVPQVILAIQVVFQPATIYRWFGISTHELNNRIVDADCLFGKEIHMVNERLGEAGDYNKMISVIEIFLLNEARRVRKDIHAIDRVFRDFLQLKIPSIEAMADQACLSYRQFDRKFIERTGISPKEYFRVTRFDQTFRVKNRFPELDWSSIAMKFGYYDYQHLVKDYKYFTGLTPHQLLSEDNSPEKLIGDAET